MSTAALCGLGGSITGSTATEISSWEVTLHQDTPEVTSMDGSAGWKEFIACLKGASGTMVTYKHPTVGLHTNCTFTDSAGGYDIVGDIIINKIDDANPVEGAIAFTSDFVFTGTVTAG